MKNRKKVNNIYIYNAQILIKLKNAQILIIERDFMKKYLAVTLALPILWGSSSVKSFEFPEKLPFGEVSANVSYYSQYIWRGEQQNTGQSAVQGGFDYSLGLVDTYIDFLCRYLGL